MVGLTTDAIYQDAVSPRRGETIQQTLVAAKELLEMDVAVVGELDQGRLTVRAVAGEGGVFGVEPGVSAPREGTYCAAMVCGELPNAIPDTATAHRGPSKTLGSDVRVGAYIGVPVRYADGSLFGSLCCASLGPKHSLGERDVRFMHVFAKLIAGELDRDRLEGEKRALQQRNEQLHCTATGVIALLTALDARDRYTGTHSEAVVELAVEVGKALELPASTLTDIAHVALLHDTGKIGIPDRVLQKPGPLDEDEWRLMRSHPVIGARMIESVDSLAHLAPAIRAEHERWDGRGYPDGLAGEDIPLASRIVLACDAFHAMSSTRPYRGQMTPEETLTELGRGHGTQFCPHSVDALLSILRDFSWSENGRATPG